MKKFFLILFTCIVLFSLWFYSRNPLRTTVTIRGAVFTVDVAVTAKDKELGLGNRDALAWDQGMLFIYDHKERYPFWMRNMRFSIDMIWIDDTTIVDITKNVPLSDKPVEDLPIYHPVIPVDKVLELPAGTADRFGITVGNRITIKS